jgi:hypothetical protein
MEKQGKKMSQLNRNGDAAGNPNKRRSLYLANIIFLSCLTIAALVFALFVFFRLAISDAIEYNHKCPITIQRRTFLIVAELFLIIQHQ